MSNKKLNETSLLGGLSTGPLSPGYTSADGPDYPQGVHNLDHQQSIDRINAFLRSVTDKQFLNPYYPIERVRNKLILIGVGFPDVNDISGDQGRIELPLNQFGGRYGFTRLDGIVRQDDGISHKVLGGLHLLITWSKIKGLYTIDMQVIRPDTELSDVGLNEIGESREGGSPKTPWSYKPNPPVKNPIKSKSEDYHDRRAGEKNPFKPTPKTEDSVDEVKNYDDQSGEKLRKDVKTVQKGKKKGLLSFFKSKFKQAAEERELLLGKKKQQDEALSRDSAKKERKLRKSHPPFQVKNGIIVGVNEASDESKKRQEGPAKKWEKRRERWDKFKKSKQDAPKTDKWPSWKQSGWD